jgi:hypothetical protein
MGRVGQFALRLVGRGCLLLMFGVPVAAFVELSGLVGVPRAATAGSWHPIQPLISLAGRWNVGWARRLWKIPQKPLNRCGISRMFKRCTGLRSHTISDASLSAHSVAIKSARRRNRNQLITARGYLSSHRSFPRFSSVVTHLGEDTLDTTYVE